MRKIRLLGILSCVILSGFALLTSRAISPVPLTLLPAASHFEKIKILDRNYQPLSITYQNSLNLHDYVALHEIPEFFQDIFIFSEDRRFYEHAGIDWKARASAVYQNIKSLRPVRGASTISEQVVRIIKPRSRTIWSRWIEGFEAQNLEEKFSKAEILEFYLNEIPFARQRRGIVQAARTYFDRDIGTLSKKEMILLTVLVRAPGRLDPLKAGNKSYEPALLSFLSKLRDAGKLSESEFQAIKNEPLNFKQNELEADASHFVRFINKNFNAGSNNSSGKVVTTIDSYLQKRTSQILNSRLKDLKNRNVSNGAVLVVDHVRNEIIAWVNSGEKEDAQSISEIDAVLALRQPGSALKPFLYAMALENGWNAATILEDAPLAQAVGSGMHSYRNYSRVFYGNVRLRDALGNSLNIPAIRTIAYTGVTEFHNFLRRLHFNSLTQSPLFYGEGLALGNGEVSLYELVNAYATLARGGVYKDLIFSTAQPQKNNLSERLISLETSEIISDILSDSYARRLEFGQGGLLNFPVQTAVKTGTSSDFRDVWAVGYSSEYTVGVWMGNLNRTSTAEVTGANGPALVLRSVFRELNKFKEAKSLSHHSNLIKKRICSLSGLLASENCPIKDEIFAVNNSPQETCSESHKANIHKAALTETAPGSDIKISFPTPGLNIAMDPRIPDAREAIQFAVIGASTDDLIEWNLNGEIIKEEPVQDGKYLWNLAKGRHSLFAVVKGKDGEVIKKTDQVNYIVK